MSIARLLNCSAKASLLALAHIGIKTKVKLFNSIVIPTAICASETWKTATRMAHKWNMLQQICLRKIPKVSYRDHITNEELWKRSEAQTLEDIVTERRTTFYWSCSTSTWQQKCNNCNEMDTFWLSKRTCTMFLSCGVTLKPQQRTESNPITCCPIASWA